MSVVGFTEHVISAKVHLGWLPGAGVNNTRRGCEWWSNHHDPSVPITSWYCLGPWLMSKQPEIIYPTILNFRRPPSLTHLLIEGGYGKGH